MLKNSINGIKAYFGTFKLISKLGLWKYFSIPIGISVLTGLLFVSFVYFFSDDIGHFISKVWIWDFGSEVFATVSNVLGGVIIVILALVLYKHIVMALSAPFMSPVSEKIETYLLGETNHKHRNTTFSQQLVRGIRINVRNLVRELLFMIPLVILSLIPGVNIITTILIFAIQAYYVGFGNMDYTMERHFNYKESVEFVRKNRGTAIGNGVVFMFLLFVPILGFIITLPISVVAASAETVKRLDEHKLINRNTTSEIA